MGSLIWAYQLFCLQLFLFYSQFSAALCTQDQSFALLQFKQLFPFKNSSTFHNFSSGSCDHPEMISWIEDTDCCSWIGVTCNTVTGHVIGLDLSCGWLHGSIPSNSSLFLLRHLQSLNLAFNDFKLSQISSNFGQFPSLTHLNLSHSSFSGSIPSEILYLSKLVSLDLSSYFYSDGYILSMQKPVLDGLVQNLTELIELILDDVDMSTIVPSSFKNLSSSLTSLSLEDCGLHGNFPDNIFHLPNLKVLNLAYNFNLTGTLPKVNWSGPLEFLDVSNMHLSEEFLDSIGNLKSLRHLGLSSCTLVGSVPSSLGNLTQLSFLSLSYNSFAGPIPSFLSKLKLLQVLDLKRNKFIGGFPDIFENLTQLSHLYLSNNPLAGPLPSNGSKFPNLVLINLFNTSLNGSLPSWLFTLPSLEHLGLGSNQLTGSLKDGLHSSSLKSIFLENNRLHGSIPSSIFELVNLTNLDLSSNNLSGIELSMFAKLKKLEYLGLSHISLSPSTTFKVTSFLPQLWWLTLSSCNISEFPNILRRADQLQYLDLSNNKIHGQIPNWMLEIGKDTLYWLNLSQNFLTSVGQLPWKNLEYLDLHSNLIQGPLPTPPPHLKLLLLSNNKLRGKIPLSICNMSAIEVLDFSNNTLSGSIPKCLGNFSSFHVLDLQKNRFYGNIPGTFAEGNHLRTLNFNSNELDGPIPESLINCTNLEILDLGNNKISDSFPYWLENLPKLQVLVLRHNKFYGSIRGSTRHSDSFPMLRIFDISNNNFSDFLPWKYFENLKAMMNLDEAKGKLNYLGETHYQDSVVMVIKGSEIKLQKIITTFTTIDFSNNNLYGEIPESIGKLHALRLLNLSQNNLTGHIPSSLQYLTILESLDLSSNKFVGEIPSQLISLTFLAILNLSQNQLQGPIPRGNQFYTFKSDSYNGNLGLCGFPLSNKCDVDEATKPHSSIFHDEDHTTSSCFNWKAIMMGYGCGLMLGWFIGRTIFSTGKPQWFMRMIDWAIQKCQSRRRNRKIR